MDLSGTIERLLAGEDHAEGEAKSIMAALLASEVAEAQVAGWLVALRAKRPTAEELAEMASVLRNAAVPVPDAPGNVVDTCGTGGGSSSFNLSTAAAFVAAGAGASVAKHGNRAVTSRCGSADVLEALGASLEVAPERSGAMLREIGFAFLFAPCYHPTMKAVGPVRRALGVRTVFNFLGPLSNPASATKQVIGVFDPEMGPRIARSAKLLGAETVWVVHAEDGLDEVSPRAPTRVWTGEDEFVIDLRELGLEPVEPEALSPGQTPEENAAILKEAISDTSSPRFSSALPSAAAVLVVAGLAPNLREGIEMAQESVRRGAAEERLRRFIEESRK